MKVSGAKQVHYESGPNMTPLVDVVMVILIFLMLAGSFGSTEHYMIGSAELHSAGPSKNTNKDWVPPVVMDINVDENGDVRLRWDPTPIKGISDEDKTPLSLRLYPKIESKYREMLASDDVTSRKAEGKKPEDEVELIVTSNQKVTWERLAPVYDAALQAGVKKIGFK
jgi:biopolymer transport protein ExbD